LAWHAWTLEEDGEEMEMGGWVWCCEHCGAWKEEEEEEEVEQRY
jgi:hypothetical protein